MDPMILSIIVAFAIMALLLFLGGSIGVALALGGMIGSAVFTGSWSAALALPVIQSLSVASSYTLMVIPLFIAMGTVAGGAGITSDLFASFYRWVGRIPGGIAIATIGTCAGMASITGSSLAVSSAMSKIAMPELRKYKYDDRLSFGSIAMGGTVAIMIPPSITLVLYAIFAEQSVGQMLMAGMLPGFLIVGLYMAMIVSRCIVNPLLGPTGPRFSWRERFASLRDVVPFMLIVTAIILGILLGIWTPTESAAVGLLMVIAMALARRRLSLRSLFDALTDAVIVSASIFVVVIGSLIFGNFIALNGLGEVISQGVISLHLSPFILFMLFVIVYLILGMFMEATSILALTVPLALPIITEIGWHPVWFGVILVCLMEVAAVTPPVGLNLFAVKASIAGSSIADIAIGSAPFWCMNLIAILVLYFYPQIALLLPMMMIGK